jgi:hypothetical protein
MNPTTPVPPRVAQINSQIAASPLASQGISQAPSAALPPKSPTVLSNANIIESTIPKLQQKAAVETTPLSVRNNQQLDPEGNVLSPYQSLVDSLDDDYTDENLSLINQMKDSADEQTGTLLDSITQNYKGLNNRLANQQNYTTAQGRGLLASVGANHTGSSIDFLRQKMAADLQEVQDLNTKENLERQKVIQAQRDNDYRLMEKSLDVLSNHRKEKLNLLSNIADKQVQINEDNRKFDRDQMVQTQKDLDSVLQSVSKNGAPEAVKRAVMGAKTLSEAIDVAGDYLTSESDKLDVQYKKAQISKIYSDIANDKAKADATSMDPSEIIAYANEYAATGKIPTGLPKGSFGTVAGVAKELPKTQGQILSTATGVAPTGDATLQTALGSLYSAVDLAKQLKGLDKKRADGLVAGTLGKVFGSDDQQRYLDLRGQIVDLLARARSGAALTPSEEERYSGMLPGRFSESLFLGPDSEVKIDNFINNITRDVQNKASTQGWAINGFSKVKAGGNEYTVGDVITVNGIQGRINADGTVTQLTQ